MPSCYIPIDIMPVNLTQRFQPFTSQGDHPSLFKHILNVETLISSIHDGFIGLGGIL
jgi:hypothetical protein